MFYYYYNFFLKLKFTTLFLRHPRVVRNHMGILRMLMKLWLIVWVWMVRVSGMNGISRMVGTDSIAHRIVSSPVTPTTVVPIGTSTSAYN